MAANGIHRGIVTRVSGTQVWVKMQGVWPGVEFGPLSTLANTIAGDRVLVAEVTTDDFVVLGVIQSS